MLLSVILITWNGRKLLSNCLKSMSFLLQREDVEVIVVDNGRIIEFGTQEELLKKKGKYYRLVQIQSMSEDILKKKETEGIA